MEIPEPSAPDTPAIAAIREAWSRTLRHDDRGTGRKAFLPAQKDGIPATVDVYNAWEGLRRMDFNICWYYYDWGGFDPLCLESPGGEQFRLTRQDYFWGGLPQTRRAFRYLGVEFPPPVDYPESLRSFMGRSVREMPLREMYDSMPFPYFVKPAGTRAKVFTGCVVRSPADWDHFLDRDENETVWVSHVMEFVSEHRVYLSHGKIVDMKHYAGDPFVSPAADTVRAMVEAWREAPVFCSIDVGIDLTGATRLVECNDGFALGSYDLDSLVYANGLVDRWDQLMTAGAGGE